MSFNSYDKYIKYKNKYFILKKNLYGGDETDEDDDSDVPEVDTSNNLTTQFPEGSLYLFNDILNLDKFNILYSGDEDITLYLVKEYQDQSSINLQKKWIIKKDKNSENETLFNYTSLEDNDNNVITLNSGENSKIESLISVDQASKKLGELFNDDNFIKDFSDDKKMTIVKIILILQTIEGKLDVNALNNSSN